MVLRRSKNAIDDLNTWRHSGTNIESGLSEANDMLSGRSATDGANKVVILLSDGDYNRGDDPTREAAKMKNSGIEIFSIGFADQGQAANTLKGIASEPTEDHFFQADNATQLVNAFTDIAYEITAMINDQAGDDVTIVENSLAATIDGVPDDHLMQSGNTGFRWNPDTDQGLKNGQTLKITYQVKLNSADPGSYWENNNVVLNDNAHLTYRLGNHNEANSLELEPLTTTVDVAQLTIYNQADDAQPVQSGEPQYVFVYSDVDTAQTPFSWTEPSATWNDVNYNQSTLTAGDISEDVSDQTTYTPGNAGTYTLVHKYRSAQEGQLTLQIYLDGQPMEITEDNLNKYISNLTNSGDTDSVTLTYNDGKVVVSYDYEKYNSADLNFKVTDGLVLQAVDGEFIVGQSWWKGVVPEKNGTMTVDNVKGDSTLKIYLNTAYTVSYSPTEAAETTDNSTYIVSKQTVTEPDIARSDDEAKDLSDEQRSEGHLGGWSTDKYKTEVTLANVTDGYTGGYTTETGSEKHANTISGAEIATVADIAGAENVIECYAREEKPAITGIEKKVVTAPVDGIEGDYQYPEAAEEGNPQLTVNEGDEVTLLYAITVTGEAGAGFSVSESQDNAELVKVVGATEAYGPVEGALFTGTLDGETATLYVSVDYGAQDTVGSVTLKNAATVTNTDPDADGPDEDTATETVDEEVTPVYDITSIEKTYIASEDQISETATEIDFSKYAVPDKESNSQVIVPNDGTNVTLLYSIKVTGTEGATFTVKDGGATFVTYESDEIDNGKAVISGAKDTFTGTIPEDGEVTFYVEKSFNKDDVVDGKLPNTATIEGDVDPDQDEATENVPAEVEKVKLDSIDKVYIADSDSVGKTEPEIGSGAYTYPDSEIGKVVVPENGEVTLLYGITVKGTPGAQFVVTDDSANFVACASSDKLDDGKAAVSGSKDLFEGTLPADGEVTFYVSKTFTADDIQDGKLTNTAAANLLGEKDTINDTEKTDAVKEDKPNIPTGDDLIALIGDKVTVDCINGMVNHDDKTYGLLKDGYDVDETLGKNDQGQYTFNVTIKPDVYVDQYSSDMKKEHTLQNAGSSFTITLTWDGIKWIVPTDNVVLKVECQYAITAFDKFLVDTDDEKTATGLAADELARYTFPDANDTVNVPKNGKVTLLYGITVTGTAGESFTVKDTGAVPAPNADDVIEIDADGNFTGTIPESGSITFYVERVFTADDIEVVDGKDCLINKATIVGDVTPGEEDDDEIVPAATGYSLTYEANGGYFANDATVTTATVNELEPGTYDLWSEENNTIPVGADGNALAEPSHDQAAPPEDTVITDADLVDVVLIGWTKEVPESVGEIYAAGEAYPALTNDAIITEDDVIVYAVWGYDENGDGIADATQVFITPADITVYTGGDVYGGVVDAEGNEISTTENAGLPEPGYFITLPYDVQAWLTKQTGTEYAANLSDYLEFTYNGTDGTATGTTSRTWTLVDQGVYDRDENGNVARYVYSLNPATVDGEQIPVRLTYFDDADNDGQLDNGETVLDDDAITMAENLTSDQFKMIINPGELNQQEIKASFKTTDGNTEGTPEPCTVAIGTGTLTVKSVVNQDTTNTNAIVSDANSVDTNVQTAVADDSVQYYVNDSEVKVPVANDRVQLLVDSVSNNNDFNDQMGQHAIDFVDGNSDTHSYKLVYMDLVDTENGNTQVTLGDNDELTIYWPMPEDANENGEFHVVHYTGMDRTDVVTDLNAENPEQLDVTPVTINNQTYLTFSVGSFSPFALVYETDNGGSDTPDNPGWTPGGSGDEPDGLNTEDHFSYIVGYAEDYRTGEPTDNEDLWPVKPNNQITRAEVATIFYRLLEDEVRDEYDTIVNDFSDVSADSWYNQTVSTLASMGIVKGYEDGTFRPNAPITRAEFGAIATRFFAETGATYEPGTFSDVIGDEWYANAIQDAVNLGLIGGYEDGTVRPNNNITRAEACAIVNRTLGRVPDADHLLPDDVMKTWPDNPESAWFYADMQEATNGHEYEWITEDGNKVENWTDLLDKDWNDR